MLILVYFVFDVMYVNGEIFTNEPYSYRFDKIRRLIG